MSLQAVEDRISSLLCSMGKQVGCLCVPQAFVEIG